MATQIFSRQALIEKANRMQVITVGVAVFLVVFSLISMKALVSQARYQNRVIKKQKIAVETLKKDVQIATDLSKSYQAFVSSTKNVIGGLSDGTEGRDGNNAKIVLDALPGNYNFPALATNIEALVASQGVKLNSITGKDDEIAQTAIKQSGTPQQVIMPFEVSFEGDYAKTQQLVKAFERSIRPMQFLSVGITGSQDKLSTTIKAQTYYQPAKVFEVKKEVVK